MRSIWVVVIAIGCGPLPDYETDGPPGGNPDGSVNPPRNDSAQPRGCNGGNVLCVDGQSSAGSPDGSEDRPYRSVQDAVDAASSGTVVQVATGTYRENIRIDVGDFQLLGGFSRDFQQRDVQGLPTTLEGLGGASVVHVFSGTGILVEGFRITGGTGTPINERGDGGGIYVATGARDVTIAQNEIFDNVCDGGYEAYGGGIASDGTNVTIRDNWIHDNQAGRGAGISIDVDAEIQFNVIENNVGVGDHGGGLDLEGSVHVYRNLIRGNRCGGDYGWGGAALVVSTGTLATFEWNVITDNYAPTYGSGIFVDEGASAVLRNELIYANRCNLDGGVGVALDGGGGSIGSDVTIENSTISWNDCPGVNRGGNGILVDSNSSAVFKNSIFWRNGGSDFYTEEGGTVSGSYSINQDGLGGSGNFADDPEFADPAGGDFHLRSQAGRYDPDTGGWVNDGSTSPALDRGDPSSPYQDEPSPNGGRVNLGHTGNSAEASKSN